MVVNQGQFGETLSQVEGRTVSSGLKPNTMVHGTVIQIIELSHRKHPPVPAAPMVPEPGSWHSAWTNYRCRPARSSLTSLAAQGMQGTSILAAA